MKKLLSTILLSLAMLMPTALWAQSLAGDSAIVAEAYVVLSTDSTGSTLTFYYDDQKENREGWMPMGQDGTNITWTNYAQGITKVVFDESFANCTTLTSTASWFSGFNNLVNIEGIEYLKTDNVADMSYMFNHCSSLTSLDVSGFKTDNVTDMSAMFYNCIGLTSLDVSGFKTDNMTYTSVMFWGCAKLTTIYVASEWSTAKVEYGDNMFTGCTKLVGGAGTVYDADHVDYSYAHIDGGPSNPGYFTDKNAAIISDDIIQFADANVKAICVSNWDTNGDGELSKTEAAAVTDLGEVFKGNTEITRFNELVNFTGLSAIGDYAFSNCNNLQEVTMPQTITRIGHDAFNSCKKMVLADIPLGVTEINYQAFYGCSSLTSFVIPDGVTFITYNAFTGTGITSIVPAGYEKGDKCGVIPESVTQIATQALLCHNLVSVILPAGVQKLDGNPFVGCNALKVLMVEEGNSYYHAEGNCIIETATSTVSVGCNVSVIPSYVRHIGENAFCNLNFVEFEVPEGIISVEKSAFNNSFYLQEVTLPSTLESLSEYAFYACKKLTTLKVKMTEPIEIGNIFTENALNTLYVPKGTAEKYRNAEWWKNFENIFEMEPDVNYSFDNNGVLWVDSDVTMAQVMEEASKIHNVAEHITAIVWNSSKPLTNADLQEFDNPNMLIYVASDFLAPQNRNNIVVGDYAKNVVLTDAKEGNNNFYCPQAFTAEKVTYTRNFQQHTQVGVSQGWESIALPFNVQTITHEKQGMIAPFGNTASEKHFWLRRLGDSGLIQATKIEANVPYIISMPNNNEAYNAEYNLSGKVTFTAQDVVVPVTAPVTLAMADNSVMMVPAFQSVGRSSDVWALNVGEVRGQYLEGSAFERDYREIRPFEAYTVHRSNTPAPRFVPIKDMTNGDVTGIEDVRGLMSDGRGEGAWYDLNGQKLQLKPTQKGVYIRNGRKVIIK